MENGTLKEEVQTYQILGQEYRSEVLRMISRGVNPNSEEIQDTLRDAIYYTSLFLKKSNELTKTLYEDINNSRAMEL